MRTNFLAELPYQIAEALRAEAYAVNVPLEQHVRQILIDYVQQKPVKPAPKKGTTDAPDTD